MVNRLKYTYGRTQEWTGLKASREGIDSWREYEAQVNLAKSLSDREGFMEKVVSPAISAVFNDMIEDLDLLRHYYGIAYDPYRKERVTVEPELTPRTRREQITMEYTLYRVELASYLWVTLRIALPRAERRGEDVDETARKAFLAWLEHAPAYEGSFARRTDQPAMKRAACLALANWLAVNPLLYPDTRKALRADGIDLFEALPAAGILAFDDLRPGEPLRRGDNRPNLVSRAEKHLAIGIEKDRADADPDLFENEDEEVGMSFLDRDLVQFFERESAALSQQQREFFALAASGMSNKEISEKTQRSETHVAQVLLRVRRRFRLAAGL